MTDTDLQRLQKEMRACRACLQAGYEITPGAIFSGGAGAQIMIIGQAPGVTEVEAGRPFNAGSGTRLFRWLQRAGLSEETFRSEQYLTSITKCFPGKAVSGGGDRVPTQGERDLCRPFLERELNLVDPAIIVPVGRLAINRYFPARLPLTKIIGTEQEIKGRWVLPLPHPSGASRWHQVPSHRKLIETALQRLAHRIDSLELL